ncbi:HAMP domain-containing sensor histidine kinase [soil metagenome]
MLTFALFVGVAVVGVGFYSFLILRGEVREAARATLVMDAERLLAQIAAVPSGPQQSAMLEEVAARYGYNIVVVEDGQITRAPADPAAQHETFFNRPEVRGALAQGVGFDERDVDGVRTYFVALTDADENRLVRIAESAPPMLVMVQRMQATLVLGMALAMVLALVGSWIAAQQVTRPLRAMSRSAQYIVEGDMERQIRVRTRAAEIQDLARSLNRMSERFRSDIHELERARRVQNEFIGNVSHEVKNPIFAVSGYIEALGSDSLTSEQRGRYAAKGLNNLQRLNNLFSDLIEIARLEYREDLLRTEALDMQLLLEEVAETLEPKAEDKGLVFQYENPPLFVHADRNRIRQVLTNLIDNAIAYTESGAVRCRMRRHRSKARIEVVDTGRGIPDEHLDRIFERFYRIDAARTRKMGGTGLGLSIVKQILQAHGEDIHVESTAGRGTRFWFELPLASPDGTVLQDDGAGFEGSASGSTLA